MSVAGIYDFADCKAYVLEDRIGEILIAFFEASYSARLRRLQEEEKRRKEHEEYLQRERIFLIKQPILKLLAEYADTLMPSKMILPILITIQTGLIGPVRKLIGLIQQWQERMNFLESENMAWMLIRKN